MGYDLYANNTQGEQHFAMGLTWTHLLEQCGSYFTCVFQGARWYMLFDERMIVHYHPSHDSEERVPTTDRQYPAIICNCGFAVTEEEAHVLARIARNYAALQRTLPEPSEEEMHAPIDTPDYRKPFPRYIRRDWVDLFERFAEWADTSEGFKIF